MTAFTVTVDAKIGTSTGISAGDRARTLRALADAEVTGHRCYIYPLITSRMYVRSIESILLLEITSDVENVRLACSGNGTRDLDWVQL